EQRQPCSKRGLGEGGREGKRGRQQQENEERIQRKDAGGRAGVDPGRLLDSGVRTQGVSCSRACGPDSVYTRTATPAAVTVLS
ncbi:unnamed protein product, partial [Ectocarpus sp. 12 AP-2014]